MQFKVQHIGDLEIYEKNPEEERKRLHLDKIERIFS